MDDFAWYLDVKWWVYDTVILEDTALCPDGRVGLDASKMADLSVSPSAAAFTPPLATAVVMFL